LSGVRDFCAGDFDEVLRMNNENDPAVSWLERDELEADLKVAKHALVIGDDEVKGFCVTFASGLARDLGVNYRWFTERYPDFVYLDRVVVDAPHRSQRHGEALYREVERRIIAEGKTTLFACEVNLRPRNDGSLRFHARLGFEQVGEQESKPGLVVAMLAKCVG
jgi:predicted GNAT superfamily acetyltransferase